MLLAEGAVAEVLLAGAPLRRCCWPCAVTERYREDVAGRGAGEDWPRRAWWSCWPGSRGKHISEELRPAGQPSVSRELVHKKKRMTFVCDGHPLSILLSPLAILNSPFYQARLAAPRIAASDSFSDEGKTFTFPRQNETTSSSIYF